MESEKLSQDEYFMKIAEVVKERSGCIKRKVGAVLVKDNHIISTGYNQTPKGYINCENGGCKRCSSSIESGKNLETCLCNHAESNLITQNSFNGGTSSKDATVYTTFSPCIFCSKELINSGIKRIVYKEEYQGIEEVKKLLKKCKVKIERIK